MNDDTKRFLVSAAKNLRQVSSVAPRFVVIGDVMVDCYVYGEVKRISPEAPVPVLQQSCTRLCPGGAANVAHNLMKLGALVALVGRVGSDEDGAFLTAYFSGCCSAQLVTFPALRTERKTRYIAEHQQQLLRVDESVTLAADCRGDKRSRNRLCQELRTALSNSMVCGIVVADYDKGTIAEDVLEPIRASRARCYLECKPESLPMYRANVGSHTTLKPNLREFERMGGQLDDAGKVVAPREFAKTLGIDELLITRGRDGMTLVYDDLAEQLCLPRFAREVYNVTGAGDTVLATYAWACACGLSSPDAALLANVAAAEAVQHHDTNAVSREQLLAALDRHIKENGL
jgi:D-beta-D-heptose 7-phosphate kinase/D-beta-D-heptose 1-phosphate adenosyltransferase